MPATPRNVRRIAEQWIVDSAHLDETASFKERALYLPEAVDAVMQENRETLVEVIPGDPKAIKDWSALHSDLAEFFGPDRWSVISRAVINKPGEQTPVQSYINGEAPKGERKKDPATKGNGAISFFDYSY